MTATITGLTGALYLERARRHDLAKVVEELRGRLANLERVDRNPLYRDSLEDQRARQLRAADDAATGIEFMEQAIRTLRGKGNDKP
jgi:hypothetical protein